MSFWSKSLANVNDIIDRSLKVLGNRIVRNARLKTTNDYLSVISGQTRNSIISRVTGMELQIAVGTWWGAAYNVEGGFSRFGRRVSAGYSSDAANKARRRGQTAAWTGRGSFRPFLIDAVKEEAVNFADIIKTEMNK